MVQTEEERSPNRAQRRAQNHHSRRLRSGIRPALVSVVDAAHYLGVERSTFYARFLPDVESIRIGKRRLIVMEALDRLVEQLRRRDSA